MVEVDKGHETRQSAIAWREHVFVAATVAWESRNVIRLTDIKLKYPFWEFAASRVADLPVMFPLSAFSSPFFSLPFFPSPPPLFIRSASTGIAAPSLSGPVPGRMLGRRGKNRIFHCDVVERAGPRVVVNLICLSDGRIDALVISSDTRAQDI